MQISLYDENNRYKKLSKLGDCLERLNKVISWEMFRPILEEAHKKKERGAGGRPPYDYVLMFKILVLQRLYNLSDDQVEYQVNDRLSFMRFLGLGLGSPVPDAKTVWHFRETLKDADSMRQLFDLFHEKLEDEHLITHTGTIVDATFVDAPRQRNSRDENKEIKAGNIPEEWKKAENKHKLAQKDTDARWAKKGNETHYGYKNHAKADADTKFVTDYTVTAASVHDSQELNKLLDETDTTLYADSAYSGKAIREKLSGTLTSQIHEKATRSHPLTEEQKANDRNKSKICARIEHIFGFMTGSMHGITLRTVGMKRAACNIGLTNLVYNLCRYEILHRLAVQAA